MSVGNQPSVESINAQLTLLATALRNDCQNILNFQEWLNGANGIGAAGLEALGFTSEDATAAVSFSNYLNTVAGGYYGTATQGTDFNFSSATSPLWAGQ